MYIVSARPDLNSDTSLSLASLYLSLSIEKIPHSQPKCLSYKHFCVEHTRLISLITFALDTM